MNTAQVVERPVTGLSNFIKSAPMHRTANSVGLSTLFLFTKLHRHPPKSLATTETTTAIHPDPVQHPHSQFHHRRSRKHNSRLLSTYDTDNSDAHGNGLNTASPTGTHRGNTVEVHTTNTGAPTTAQTKARAAVQATLEERVSA